MDNHHIEQLAHYGIYVPPNAEVRIKEIIADLESGKEERHMESELEMQRRISDARVWNMQFDDDEDTTPKRRFNSGFSERMTTEQIAKRLFEQELAKSERDYRIHCNIYKVYCPTLYLVGVKNTYVKYHSSKYSTRSVDEDGYYIVITSDTDIDKLDQVRTVLDRTLGQYEVTSMVEMHLNDIGSVTYRCPEIKGVLDYTRVTMRDAIEQWYTDKLSNALDLTTSASKMSEELWKEKYAKIVKEVSDKDAHYMEENAKLKAELQATMEELARAVGTVESFEARLTDKRRRIEGLVGEIMDDTAQKHELLKEIKTLKELEHHDQQDVKQDEVIKGLQVQTPEPEPSMSFEEAQVFNDELLNSFKTNVRKVEDAEELFNQYIKK